MCRRARVFYWENLENIESSTCSMRNKLESFMEEFLIFSHSPLVRLTCLIVMHSKVSQVWCE